MGLENRAGPPTDATVKEYKRKVNARSGGKYREYAVPSDLEGDQQVIAVSSERRRTRIVDASSFVRPRKPDYVDPATGTEKFPVTKIMWNDSSFLNPNYEILLMKKVEIAERDIGSSKPPKMPEDIDFENLETSLRRMREQEEITHEFVSGANDPTEEDLREHLKLLGRTRRRDKIVRDPFDPARDGKTVAEIRTERIDALRERLKISKPPTKS